MLNLFVANKSNIKSNPTSLQLQDAVGVEESDKPNISWRPFTVPLEGMGKSSLSSKSCANLETGYCTPIESAHVCASHNSKRLPQTGKTWLPKRLCVTNASKKLNLPFQGLHNSRFLQQIISCTKARQKMASCYRCQCPEQLYASPNFQNGDSSDNQ